MQFNVIPRTENKFSTKISVSLHQKGLQFSCHLIIGRNVKDLSRENVLPYTVLV